MVISWTPSPRAARAAAVVNLIAQSLIVVTGSVVRVTGSGLGCPSWPNCLPGSLVPAADAEVDRVHQWVEFGNRLLTPAVGLAALACLVVAWLARPRRRRPLLLAAGLVLGVGAQGVIGGITVRFDLLWWTVAVHLAVSMLLVWLSVLTLSAFGEADGPVRPVGPPVLRPLLAGTVGLLALLLFAGTLVTAAGPHAGDAATPRLDMDIELLARVHGTLLVTFLAALALLGLTVRRAGVTDRRLWRRYAVLVAVVLAQGGLGYVQYLTGVPEVLVSLHVLGAVLVVAATAGLWVASRRRDPLPAGPRPGPTGDDHELVAAQPAPPTAS